MSRFLRQGEVKACPKLPKSLRTKERHFKRMFLGYFTWSLLLVLSSRRELVPIPESMDTVSLYNLVLYHEQYIQTYGRPAILQLNVKDLTRLKCEVIEQLAIKNSISILTYYCKRPIQQTQTPSRSVDLPSSRLYLMRNMVSLPWLVTTYGYRCCRQSEWQ